MNGLRGRSGLIIFWLGWPLWRYLLGRSERSRVLITNGQKILVVKSWLGDNKWGLPGGGLKASELPAVGAARELKEELDISIEPPDLHLLWSGLHQDNGLRYTQHLFSATTASCTLRIDRKELLAAAWFTRKELSDQPLKPEVQRALALTETSLV